MPDADERGMRGGTFGEAWKDQRGYTLPEVLAAVAISGLLVIISVIILLALLERWRVEAAADQLAADMRLAHANATNQLTDWRVVLLPAEVDAESDESSKPDYFLVRLRAVCPPGCSKPDVVESRPRVFPADVRVKNHRSATSNDDQGAPRWASPVPEAGLGAAPSPTRTVEFNSDGTMAFFRGPANAACVTEDGNPMLKVEAHYPGTSSIEVAEGAGKPCDEG